jgi:hypothetical protein
MEKNAAISWMPSARSDRYPHYGIGPTHKPGDPPPSIIKGELTVRVYESPSLLLRLCTGMRKVAFDSSFRSKRSIFFWWVNSSKMATSNEKMVSDGVVL